MMLPAPVIEFAPRYVFLDARIHVDSYHHPLLHQWLNIPNLSLIDGLPGLAEEGLRLRAGCAGRFLPTAQSLPVDGSSPPGAQVQWSKRLRMKLSNVAFPYLCDWLSAPMEPVARAIELSALMEQGLQVRSGRVVPPSGSSVTALPSPAPDPVVSPAITITPEPPAEQPIPAQADPANAPTVRNDPKPKKFNLPLLSAYVSPIDQPSATG